MKFPLPISLFLSVCGCLFFSSHSPGSYDRLEKIVGIENVTIPGFQENGLLSWELTAKEVNFRGKDLYEAVDLNLRSITGFTRSSARSSSGLFNSRFREAKGNGLLSIQANGFSAEGEEWIWREKTKEGKHLMAFKENGKILFEQDLILTESFSQNTKTSSNNEKKSTNDKKFGTFAEAQYIELIELSNQENRFLLRGKVSIVSDELQIKCGEVELMFIKDENQTQSSLGRISKIFAQDLVELQQHGRKSFSDFLTIDSILGEAELKGNARVEDQDWGVVRGERILLHKGMRKAQVIGGDGNRPRMELPALPSLEFPLNAVRKKE